jgi:hypothetical protein
VWPDDAATGIYAEQVANALVSRGIAAVLVGGVGRYRRTARPRPDANIVRLDHFCGQRGDLIRTAMEYYSLSGAFRRYIEQYVNSGDVVIVGSFPPTTIHLARRIHGRGATAIYWLQDYYPELIRAIWNYPRPLRRLGHRIFNRQLREWDFVVKCAGNLAYDGRNSKVIRNWPSFDLGPPQPMMPKTALYFGGLGYAHSLPLLIKACEKLRGEGYSVTVRGDGPGFRKLPPWIFREAPVVDLTRLVKSYWEAEVHLVAADPRIQGALFPSKFWNSLATGRRIVSTGFEGAMADELHTARASPYQTHLGMWGDLVASLV